MRSRMLATQRLAVLSLMPASRALGRGALFAGRFRIESELGRGGMGVVYAAHDERCDREVAVKIIARKLADDPEFVERFERECKAIGALDHENIVRIYDANVTPDGLRYLVMPRLEGMSLRALLRASTGRRLSLPHATRVAIQIADAVRVAHTKGIAHRDIKPENVMVGKRAHVWLLDFGLAKRAGGGAATDEQRILGTHRYMAPEQIAGRERPDRRVDLYQIGCVYFEMLTGELPYEACNDPEATAEEILAAHVFGERTPLSALLPDAPRRATAIVDRLLERDPAKRYQDAEQLGLDLYELLVEHVGPHHPAAVKSARAYVEQSGEWPAFGVPGVAAVQAWPAETAELAAAFVPSDRSPAWVPGPRGAAANDATPGASVTARGTLRMAAWREKAPAGTGAGTATATGPGAVTEPAARSPRNVTEPLPKTVRAAMSVAPVPTASLVEELARDESLSAEEGALWDEDEPGESRRRVLLHRYLAHVAGSFTSIDRHAVERAIDEHLRAIEARRRAAASGQGAATGIAAAEAAPRVSATTPHALVAPSADGGRDGWRVRRWVAAVAAGFAIASVAAGVRWWMGGAASEAMPAAGAEGPTTAAEGPAVVEAPASSGAEAAGELATAAPSSSATAAVTARPSVSAAAKPATPPAAAKPVTAPAPASTKEKPPAPKASAPVPSTTAKPVAPFPVLGEEDDPTPPKPKGTMSKLPSNAAPRPLSPKPSQ